MKYRMLGSTGLMVSEISFGTIPILQGNIPVLPNYYNLDETQALAVMEYAYKLGCNLYDTAIVPEYGDAEIKLGKFANFIGRNRIIISDKARFFSGSEMYQAVEISCKNLGTTPDLYFVHQVDANHEDEVFGPKGALDALVQLKTEGKIRYVGIATHYYDILLRGAKDDRVDVLQGSGNLLERGMLERIQKEPLFHKKGFLVNKIYAAGLLSAKFSVQTLIDFVLSYPISSALIGLGTKAQVNAAMCQKFHTAKSKIPSFAEVLSVLEKEYTPIPCDRCQRCVCPFGTEIHTIFRQYQYFYLGKDFWALKKLSLGIAESARHCRECVLMPCIDACPYKIRIPQKMQEVEQLVQNYNPLFGS